MFTGKWANNWAAYKSHFKVYGKAPTILTPQVSTIFRGIAACWQGTQVRYLKKVEGKKVNSKKTTTTTTKKGR